MKAIIKKIEELNAVALDIKEKQNQAEALKSRWMQISDDYHNLVDMKKYIDYTDEDKKALDNACEAGDKWKQALVDCNKAERKFIRDVKALAKSIGFEIKGSDTVDIYDSLGALNDIASMVKSMLSYLNDRNNRWFYSNIKITEEITLNYKEVQVI